MKKVAFLLILFFSFWFGNAKAQLVKSFGIRAGFASTFPEIKELQNGNAANDEVYNRNMIYPELQVELLPQNHFSLLANVSYISKGFDYWDSWTGGWASGAGSARVNANVDYFTTLIAPKFSKQINKITLYGFTGPYIGFRNAYDAYYVQGLTFGDNIEVQVLKPRIWGGTIGGGIEFKGKSNRFYYSVQAQYMEDFNKAVDYHKNFDGRYGRNYDYLFKAKFRTLLLSYGLHYSFKNKLE